MIARENHLSLFVHFQTLFLSFKERFYFFYTGKFFLYGAQPYDNKKTIIYFYNYSFRY
ncbi:protein of unknown function [Candidatus Nitrosacidococcus tergens]|uniref:Uncharacterized protein n=1 Tax=Candidatus Nitrosacidococcus tergens TaxID=553981 RepID=A0A7G1QAM5_9GAMM|nr:protein of unknown function [Candidatus Nitrosacidococcus tergens]